MRARKKLGSRNLRGYLRRQSGASEKVKTEADRCHPPKENSQGLRVFVFTTPRFASGLGRPRLQGSLCFCPEEIDQTVGIVGDDAVDASSDEFLHVRVRIGGPSHHPEVMSMGIDDEFSCAAISSRQQPA